MRRKRLLPALLLPALLFTSCADGADVAPLSPSRPTLAKAAAPAVLDGRVGQADYRIHVPANWNGKLILYAHGYQTPSGAPVLPAEDPILGGVFEAMRGIVVDQLGYALAYSSYRDSGYTVKEGAQATHQLRGIFASKVGQPTHTYLAGHSLGGMAALKLAEEHSAHYDGALVMCSFVGGSRAEVDYIYHTRAVFDAFYPNALPGSLYDGEAKTLQQFLAEDAPNIQAAALANPAGVGAAILAEQTRLPGRTPEEYGAALAFALYFHHISADDLLSRTHGQPFFDNQGTVYAPIAPVPGTEPLFAHLNASVERSSSSPAAESFIRRYYEPTGDLHIPVLTLHTTHDPVTPAWQEALYAQRVAAAGASDNLRQWGIEGFGHCNANGLTPDPLFTVKTIEALRALTGWVEAGVVPPNVQP